MLAGSAFDFVPGAPAVLRPCGRRRRPSVAGSPAELPFVCTPKAGSGWSRSAPFASHMRLLDCSCRTRKYASQLSAETIQRERFARLELPAQPLRGLVSRHRPATSLLGQGVAPDLAPL